MSAVQAVQDVNMLPSLLNCDPIVVTRLRRMRQVKRQPKPVNIFKRWDNNVREEMDNIYCLRRNKYVTRLGLYYWIQARDKACESCASASQQEWIAREQPYIVMMKASPVARGGLDFARVAVGLGMDISCFGSMLKTARKNPFEQPNHEHEHQHEHEHRHATESHVRVHSRHAAKDTQDPAQENTQTEQNASAGGSGQSYEDYLAAAAKAAQARKELDNVETETFDFSLDGQSTLGEEEFAMLKNVDRIIAEDESIYTGYQNLYVGVDEVFAAHEMMLKKPEILPVLDKDYGLPSDFSHFSPDHSFFNDNEADEDDSDNAEVDEDSFALDEEELTYNMQNNHNDKASARDANKSDKHKTRKSATKVSAGKALTGNAQRPGAKPAGRAAKSKFLMSA
jgi:hypothetical protein